MPVLYAHIRAFNLYVESPKLYSLYFVACTCICILFLPEQWNCCTKLSQLFLFHFLIHAHSTNTLDFWLTDE